MNPRIEMPGCMTTTTIMAKTTTTRTTTTITTITITTSTTTTPVVFVVSVDSNDKEWMSARRRMDAFHPA